MSFERADPPSPLAATSASCCGLISLAVCFRLLKPRAIRILTSSPLGRAIKGAILDDTDVARLCACAGYSDGPSGARIGAGKVGNQARIRTRRTKRQEDSCFSPIDKR